MPLSSYIDAQSPLDDPPHTHVDWLGWWTLTGWGMLVGIGVMGWVASPGRAPYPLQPSPQIIPIELMPVTLAQANSSNPDSAEKVNANTSPIPLPTALQKVPDLPSPIAMEKPTDTLTAVEAIPALPSNKPNSPDTFPEPREKSEPLPTHLHASSHLGGTSTNPAAPSTTSPDVHGASIPLTHLTFGIGEGSQPSPRYPLAAVREGQEGRVTVEFLVGTHGRVESTKLVQSCPWPLLNAEAVRVIRRSWSFPKGPVRRYQVSIVFHLNP